MNMIHLTINGEACDRAVTPRTSLADFLREHLHLTGTHVSCEHGVCGACNVMVDGQPTRSCIIYAVQADGHDIRTIEGMDEDPLMGELRAAFKHEHALQCGYCTPGMLMTARDIVTRLGDPGEERVRAELAGNLCRCTGYVGIVKAIRSVGAAHHTVASTPRRSTKAPMERAASPQAPAVRPAARAAATEPAVAREIGSAPAKEDDAQGILQTFVIRADIDRTWNFFRDLPSVAACIPGAELTSHDATAFAGRIHVKMGPIKASVGGNGTYGFDDAARTGFLKGSGQDGFTRSRVSGSLQFALKEIEGATEVTVQMSYALQGTLAQFSRPSIVREFAVRIVDSFAAAASAKLTGATVELPRNALGWKAIATLMLSHTWRDVVSWIVPRARKVRSMITRKP